MYVFSPFWARIKLKHGHTASTTSGRLTGMMEGLQLLDMTRCDVMGLTRCDVTGLTRCNATGLTRCDVMDLTRCDAIGLTHCD